MKAIHDIWFVGDSFLKMLSDVFDSVKQNAKRPDAAVPFMLNYFNIFCYYQQITSGVKHATARILNSLIEGLNTRPRLPKVLIVMPNKDLIGDINVFEFGAHRVIADAVRYLVRQINMLINHKKLELQDKKPGQSLLVSHISFL